MVLHGASRAARSCPSRHFIGTIYHQKGEKSAQLVRQRSLIALLHGSRSMVHSTCSMAIMDKVFTKANPQTNAACDKFMMLKLPCQR